MAGYFEVSFDTGAMPLTFAFSLVTPGRSSSSSSECAQYSIWTRAGQRSLERWELTRSGFIYQVRSRIASSWLLECFEFTTRAISEQEIDIRRANALAGRIVRNLGQPFGPVGGITHLFPTPQGLSQ